MSVARCDVTFGSVLAPALRSAVPSHILVRFALEGTLGADREPYVTCILKPQDQGGE